METETLYPNPGRTPGSSGPVLLLDETGVDLRNPDGPGQRSGVLSVSVTFPRTSTVPWTFRTERLREPSTSGEVRVRDGWWRGNRDLDGPVEQESVVQRAGPVEKYNPGGGKGGSP